MASKHGASVDVIHGSWVSSSSPVFNCTGANSGFNKHDFAWYLCSQQYSRRVNNSTLKKRFLKYSVLSLGDEERSRQPRDSVTPENIARIQKLTKLWTQTTTVIPCDDHKLQFVTNNLENFPKRVLFCSFVTMQGLTLPRRHNTYWRK